MFVFEVSFLSNNLLLQRGMAANPGGLLGFGQGWSGFWSWLDAGAQPVMEMEIILSWMMLVVPLQFFLIISLIGGSPT